jgi:hypothetical protein
MSQSLKIKTFVAVAGFALALSGAAFAQSTQPDPGHPRVNQVENRIDNQQSRIDKGVSDGQINARQAARDDAKLGREQTSLNKDMAGDQGHITRGEQRNLNRRLNKGSRMIHRQRAKGAAVSN